MKEGFKKYMNRVIISNKIIIERWSSESLFEYPFNVMSISWSEADEGSSFWCDIHYI